MKIQPSKNTTKDNKYRMHKGSLKLLIDDLEQFMDDWYMVPTSVRKSLEQAHVNACCNMWPGGKIPDHITDFRKEISD